MIPGLGHSKKKAEEEKQSQILSQLSQGEEKSAGYFSNNPRIMRYTGLFVTSPPEHPAKNPSFRLQLFQLQLSMGNLRPGNWPLILIYILLLQIQPVKLQGVDSLSQKLRRLNEQFQQFKTLTKARLDMLSLNQNRNSSEWLGNRVQSLSDQWQHMSQDLEHLKQSTTQELEGLREWSRKLEKKSKRMEGRLALMERNMRENRRQAQKQKPDPDQDFFNLTQELQSQEERLAALQAQRDELLVGLKGLQESLKNQALRVTRLEGRLDEFLQFNEGGKTRGLWRAGEPLSSNITPQEYYEPRRRSQTHRGGKPGRVLDGHAQPRLQGISYSQTDHSQPTAQSRNPQQPHQYQATPNQPKPSKAHKQTSTDYLPQLDPYQPQSQIQVGTQTRPYPLKQERVQSRQTVPYPHASTHNQQLSHQRGHRMQNISFPSWPQPLSHPEHTKDRQSRTRLQAPQPHPAGVLPLPQSESFQPRVSGRDGGQEEKSDTKVIHNLLQLPVRQKIPTRPIPKKDATICNVDSVLFFPSASAENYVTFSLSLPDLPELSVCLWLRVEASHVGTLLSYATEDNDNQLVLYGRNSSASSSSLLASSSSSHHWYSSSPSLSSSSPSLDFVIGDPVYRRLPVSSLLDSRWHHLCIVWSSIQGRFWHYSDRRLTSSGSNFRKGWEIPGGGSVVLGQEQDDVGGVFDPAEGFAGQLAGFRVWNRVLSPSEVEGLAEGRGVPRGVVLGMEDIKEVHGEVQQVACECLEHCV